MCIALLFLEINSKDGLSHGTVKIYIPHEFWGTGFLLHLLGIRAHNSEKRENQVWLG